MVRTPGKPWAIRAQQVGRWGCTWCGGVAGGAGMNSRGRAVVCLADSEAILEVVSYRMSRSELCSGRQRVKLVDLAGGLEKS